MSKILLPSVTTGWNQDSWRNQIKSVKGYGIPQIALFLTGLSSNQRQECYHLLEKLPNLSIPFVHARSDMTGEEFEHLIRRFKTKRFNLHPLRYFPPFSDIKLYYPKIFIENSPDLQEPDLKGFPGICLDLTHLEDSRLTQDKNYEELKDLLNRYPIGANHISAITDTIYLAEDGGLGFGNHHMDSFTQFNYLTHLTSRYFGEYLALELTNTLDEQLELIKYLKSGPLKSIID